MFYLLFLESIAKIITSSTVFSMCILHYSFPPYQNYRYLPLGIRSWQPSLASGILLSRWSSASVNGIIRTHALLKCEHGAISSWTEQFWIYYFGGVILNPHYSLKRDSNSSDVVLSTLTRCPTVLVNKTLPYQMHKPILKRANITQ